MAVNRRKSAFIKIGANKHRMRHKPASECPAANAPACCGNMDNLKEFPANGGEHCLAIAVLIYGSGRRPQSYLASGTSGEQLKRFTQNAKPAFWFTAYKRRFTRLLGKINSNLSFKASLAEAAREPNQSFSDLCDSAGSYTRGGPARDFAPCRKECCTVRSMFSAPRSARGGSRGRCGRW